MEKSGREKQTEKSQIVRSIPIAGLRGNIMHSSVISWPRTNRGTCPCFLSSPKMTVIIFILERRQNSSLKAMIC